MTRMKKTIAILLAVLFIVTVTAGAVCARRGVKDISPVVSPIGSMSTTSFPTTSASIPN